MEFLMKYKVKDSFRYVQGVQECRIIRFVFKLLKWAQKELKKRTKRNKIHCRKEESWPTKVNEGKNCENEL